MARTAFTAILSILLTAGAFYGLNLKGHWPPPPPEKKPPSLEEPGTIEIPQVHALGRLIPTSEIIEVCAPSPGRLLKLKVKEGDLVEEGDILGEFDRSAIEKEIEGLEVQISEAKEQLNIAMNAADMKVNASEKALENAKLQEQAQKLQIEAQLVQVELHENQLKTAESMKQRMQGLDSIVSEQTQEQQQMRVLAAQAALDAAGKKLELLELQKGQGLDLAESQVRAAKAARDQVASSFPIKSLTKKLEIAKWQLQQLRFKAPTSGRILKVFVQEGEFVATNPVLQMADLTEMSCVAEVPEVFKHLIESGDEAVIKSQAFPDELRETGLRGKVEYISPMIDRPTMNSLNPFAPADRHVFDVRIKLDEQEHTKAAAFVNMQVDVQFPAPSAEQ